MKRAGSGAGSVSQRYGSEDPDPYQNVTDPEDSFHISAAIFGPCFDEKSLILQSLTLQSIALLLRTRLRY
jgi:hypothetical protein